MTFSVALYLAFKELWRNRGRFFLVSMVIALITLLVIFLAGLGEGLATANKEYLSNLGGELVVFQDQANLAVLSSQIGRSKMNDIRRTDGVADAGAIGASSVFVEYPGMDTTAEPTSFSFLGVEPGRPGEPTVLDGRSLSGLRANEAIIDRRIAQDTGLQIGDVITIKSTQAGVDQFYPVTIVGITASQQFFFQSSIFVPLFTWDNIRPKPVVGNSQSELTYNIINIKLENPADEEVMIERLQNDIAGIEVVNVVTAYENSPGYAAQQSTLNTQRGFTLLIGVLVVGGFFQIQTLQKVGQVGMLKALGASNPLVGLAATAQIIITNLLGVVLGGLATFLLALGLPQNVPIIFTGPQVIIAILTLLFIGPLGGLVSIRFLVRVEPLRALGLAS
ncbi:MAG: ABC transporter permease [Chloroflexi bacterium]|nr:ABC transporter permease [Chloroflexota bacterium]MBK6712850.1 ABC transporter permease [Chloroflexota bacterium]MBK7177546.1 ABC transporter permease [Chloroflexota bacterium]MBP6805865.1 ABC transporter permease [Chloroflexota bacterium]MBP7590313.1 ABC transporter permease [Chloroflexota bacterium]